MEFQKQYNHPKWQEKRLHIMKRDKFKCRMCESKEKTLQVHHIYYIRDVKIWDYEDQCYLTACEDCHRYLHYVKDTMNANISRIDPLHLECFAKSDLRKIARLLFNGELNAVKKYIKTLKYNG